MRYAKSMRFGLLLLLLVLLSVCSFRLFAQGHTPTAGDERIRDGEAYLWRQALGGVVLGQPVIRGQSLVAVTDGGILRAYSLAGRPLWSFSARGRLSPFLTRSPEGISYVARTGGTLISVNNGGRELWRANLGGELSGPVVLGWDGRVFAPTARRLYCYTASGTLLWRRDFDHGISAGPWLDRSGGVLLALENGDVLRIGPFGDVTGWRLPSAPSFLVSVGTPASPNPSPGSSAILALHHTGDVRMIHLSRPNDAPISLPSMPARPLAAVGGGSRVAVVLSNGQTLMLAADGETLWTADSHIRVHQQRGMGTPNEAALIYDGRGVHVLTSCGVTGFTADGRRLWFTTLTNASGLPVLDDNGVLFSGGANWILYAWRLDDRVLAQGRNPSGSAREALYGTGDPPPSSFSASPMRFNESMVRRELDTIQRGISSGNVGRNELEWIAFLKETADGGTQPRMTVAHRVSALQLLSRIASGESVPWLVQLFRRERYPVVRAAAARAIGAIGVDPGGRAIGEFAALASPGNSFRDEQVLLSIVEAIGALCRFSGPAVYDAGIPVLVMLNGANQPQTVQRQARRELESLR